MWVFLTLAVTLVVLYLGYCHHRHQYWQKKGIYVPPTFPVMGHMHHLFSKKKNNYEIIMEYLMKSKAPYIGWYEGLKPVIIVQDIGVLKNILVKDFDHFMNRRQFELSTTNEAVFNEMLFSVTGEKWKGLRSIISPTFTSGKLKGLFPLIEAKCKKLVKWCLEVGTTRDKVEMYGVFNRFTLDTIASSAFGLESNCIDNEEDEFAIAAEKISKPPGVSTIINFMIFMLSPRLFSLLRLRMVDPALDFFTESAKATLEMRKNSERRGDFMDLMLEAKREHDIDTSKCKYPVTENTIISQAVLFLFAGFQTTSAGLSFTASFLAKHPEKQERLREELRSLVEKHGELNYQAIGEAKYLDACLHEGLRLYPPAPIAERVASKDYIIPGTDVKIEKDTVVGIVVWALNRDPRIWEDPDEFKPERFLPENRTPEQNFAFHSFGQGPRNCVGMRFALLETKMVMAHLVLNMELLPAPGYEGPHELEVFPNLIKNKNGINLVFRPIKA